MQFVFKYIDPKDWEQRFIFTVHISDSGEYKGKAISAIGHCWVHLSVWEKFGPNLQCGIFSANINDFYQLLPG